MPDITNPEAIRFTNEWARPKADVLAQNYYAAKRLVNEWNSKSISSIIPNNTNEIIDGARVDGRHAVTGADITAIVTRCQEVIADYEATANAKLNTVQKVAVHAE